MPVYEEKLISPLAVRFSQEHVRSTFRNGMNLEAAVGLVEVPGSQRPTVPTQLRSVAKAALSKHRNRSLGTRNAEQAKHPNGVHAALVY